MRGFAGFFFERVSLIYFIVSLVWIAVTDSLVLGISRDNPEALQFVNAVKGIGFVSLTALVLRRVFIAELRKRWRSEGDFRLLFQNNPYPMWVYDTKTYAFLEVNNAAIARYGYTRDEFLAMRITDIRPPEELARLMEDLNADRADLAHSGIWTHRLKNQTEIFVEIRSHLLAYGGHPAALVIAQDVTDRVIAEQRARQSNERLEAISQKLVEAQEAERRHIARELHDEIGQSLTALSLLMSSDAAAQQQSSTQAQLFIADLIQKVRNLSLDLRPSMLDDLGLLATLDWHFVRFHKTTGICIDFKQSGADRRFHHTLETTLYRVIQEALTNIARHAGVQRAVIRLWVREAIELQIEDQGSGFDVARALAPERGTAGLSGMVERVRLVGGSCTIDSSPGSGTTVTVRLPIRGEDGE